MAAWVKTGVFTTPASGTTVIDITTHGNNAKGVHLWGTWANSNDSNRANASIWHGFSDGTNHRSWSANRQSNATINTQRSNSITNAIRIQDPADDSIDVEATVAMNANDITITYGSFTSGFIVHYTIFGGADVSAIVREFAASSSPHTGVGFTSDLILFGCSGNAFTNASIHAFQSFGVAHDNGSSIDQWCLFSYFGDDDLDTLGSGLNATDFTGQYDDGDFTAWQAQITVIGADGFTWTGTNADEIIALCIDFPADIAIDVGTFTKATGGAPVTQALPTLGGIPQYYYLASAFNTATDLTTNRDSRVGHGAYDEITGAGHSVIATGDNSTGTDAHSRSNNAEVLQISQNLNANGIQASATPQAITDTTPDIEWNPNTSDAFHIGFYAIEEEAPTDFDIAADPGTYVLSGVTASPVADRVVFADPGTYTIAGIAALAVVDWFVDADPGTYTIAGIAADPIPDYAVLADPGTYALAGIAADPIPDYVVLADPGTYALAGIAADTVAGYAVLADSGTYSITGVSADVIADRVVFADPSTYVVTGVTAELLKEIVLLTDPGTYTITGVAAPLIADRVVLANIGGYALTGVAADFVHAIKIDADPGTYAITGVVASLVAGYVVLADPSSYVVTGSASTLLVAGRFVSAEPGTYVLTGSAANLTVDFFITATPGSYALTGIVANTVGGFVVLALVGSYATSGINVAFGRDTVVFANTGSYAITGVGANTVADRVVLADPDTYAITGIAALASAGRVVLAAAGSYSVTGIAAEIVADRSLLANVGSYALTGVNAILLQGTLPITFAKIGDIVIGIPGITNITIKQE